MQKFDATSMFQPEHRFRSEREIRGFIIQSKGYQDEDPDRANVLLIFSTSKQRTYLVATELRLYCILDDNRKPEPHVNWSLPRDQVAGDEAPILDLETRDKTDRTGLIDIGGRHKQWLFSRDLFVQQPIETQVADLVTRSMIHKKF